MYEGGHTLEEVETQIRNGPKAFMKAAEIKGAVRLYSPPTLTVCSVSGCLTRMVRRVKKWITAHVE